MVATSQYGSRDMEYSPAFTELETSSANLGNADAFDIGKLTETESDITDFEADAAALLQGRRTTDLVRIYLQEIGRVNLLRRDEEVAEAQYVQRYMQLLELLNETAQAEGGILAVYSHLLEVRNRLTSHLG
ncbi:MAG TPA: sigma-70 factor domain-containing protein, partial [Trichocoleus sp.]